MFKIFFVIVSLTIGFCGSVYAQPLKSPFYSKEGVRFQLVKESKKGNLNFLVVPGGPGMASNYMKGLSDLLEVPGNIWLVDLPGNAQLPDSVQEASPSKYARWADDLASAAKLFDHRVLIGHSFGAALILSKKEVSKGAEALVLLNISPESFYKTLAQEKKKYNLPDLTEFQNEYAKNPSDLAVKNLIVNLVDYYFTKPFHDQGVNFLKGQNYLHKPIDWGGAHFWPNYHACVPTISTLLVGSVEDHITPIYSFQKAKGFKKKNIQTVEIHGAGHFSWIEQPEQVKKAIEKFLSQLK